LRNRWGRIVLGDSTESSGINCDKITVYLMKFTLSFDGWIAWNFDIGYFRLLAFNINRFLI